MTSLEFVSKTIKSIGTNRFEIELVEVDSGKYCIKTHIYNEEKVDFSELINDYNNAAYLFDIKVRELEGN